MAKKSNPIREWLKATLVFRGLRKTDYTLCDNCIIFHIKDIPFSKRNRLSASLAQMFPAYSFEWDHNKLNWF